MDGDSMACDDVFGKVRCMMLEQGDEGGNIKKYAHKAMCSNNANENKNRY